MKKLLIPVLAVALLVSCGGGNGGGKAPADLREETKEVANFYKELTGKEGKYGTDYEQGAKSDLTSHSSASAYINFETEYSDKVEALTYAASKVNGSEYILSVYERQGSSFWSNLPSSSYSNMTMGTFYAQDDSKNLTLAAVLVQNENDIELLKVKPAIGDIVLKVSITYYNR